MRASGPDARRGEIQLVIDLPCSMLEIDGRRLPVEVVEPAKPQRKDRTVRLNGHPISALQTVAFVVAIEEGLAGFTSGVEDERRNLLVPGTRVELRAKPRADSRDAGQIDRFGRRLGVPSRYSGPVSLSPKKELGPEP